jgi:hypothetical protein
MLGAHEKKYVNTRLFSLAIDPYILAIYIENEKRGSPM